MTAAERRALTLLAGCPSGATGAALAMNRVKQSTLDRLVVRKLVEVREHKYTNPPGLVVARYWITRAGIDAMENGNG